MQKYSLILATLATVPLFVTAGCGSEQRESATESVIGLGTAVLPLTANVNGRSYRLAGALDVDYVAPSGLTRIETRQLDEQSGALFVLSLRVGTYDLTLRNARLFRSDPGGEVEVPFTSSSVGVAQRVVVLANAATNLSWSFNVAGTVVPFDPCLPNPNAVACSTGDADGDGVANGIECSNPTSCVDTDGDGLQDVNDPDSDNDLFSDGSDPARTDACAPNAYATSCTNPSTGSVNVDVDVDETCTATPPDTCDFGGGTTVPPAVIPPAYTPALPDINAQQLQISTGPTPGTDSYLSVQYDAAPVVGFPGAPLNVLYGLASIPPGATFTLSGTIESPNEGATLLGFSNIGSPPNPFFFATNSAPAFLGTSLVALNQNSGWVWVRFELTQTTAALPAVQIIARKTVAVRVN